MSIDLSSAWAKFSRAEHHLQTLDTEIREFLDSQPYEVVEEVNADARDPFGHPAIDHTFRVRVKRERPPEWQLIVGDCLHNVRCALDHLAWTLAGSSSDDSATQFPIFESLRKYEKYGGRQTALIPEEPLAIIKGLQPFNTHPDNPRNSSLWTLHELERIDKHRQILVVSTATRTGYGTLKDRKPHDLIIGYDMLAGTAPFEDGAVVARYNVTFDRDERPPDMQMEMEFSFDIAFDPRGVCRGMPVIEGLTILGRSVARVLKRFEDS